MLKQKWRIFVMTFFIYAIIHAIRTSWASMKYFLSSAPYNFSPVFMGSLDMTVLFALAVALNIFGSYVEKGPKKYLLWGMSILYLGVFLISALIILGVKEKSLYAIIYILCGMFSCVGWPSCIFILSHYMQAGIVFSVWNGCSQFGDFIGLATSYLVMEIWNLNGGISFMAIAVYMVIILVAAYFVLPETLPEKTPSAISRPQIRFVEQKQSERSPKQLSLQLNNQDEVKGQPSNINKDIQDKHIHPATQKADVNALTVFLLPGVAIYIISFAFIKSVNAMMVTWLVFYLAMINMGKEARIIAILWSVSTFIGGILGAYLNPGFNKIIFIAALLGSSIMFIFMEGIHLSNAEVEIMVMTIFCGLVYGGPFTLIGTCIPVMLGEIPEIKKHKGSKAAIISAMQGYSLFVCGLSLMIVPVIGVMDLHWLASFYCALSALILLYEVIRQKQQKRKIKQREIQEEMKPKSKTSVERVMALHASPSERVSQVNVNVHGGLYDHGDVEQKLRNKSARGVVKSQVRVKKDSQFYSVVEDVDTDRRGVSQDNLMKDLSEYKKHLKNSDKEMRRVANGRLSVSQEPENIKKDLEKMQREQLSDAPPEMFQQRKSLYQQNDRFD